MQLITIKRLITIFWTLVCFNNVEIIDIVSKNCTGVSIKHCATIRKSFGESNSFLNIRYKIMITIEIDFTLVKKIINRLLKYCYFLSNFGA